MEPDQITSVKRMDYGEYCFRTTNIDKPPRSHAEGVTDTLVLSFFGCWSRAVLAWMSILSKANEALGDGEALVGVKDIVLNHWAKYGRHFYCRYDYEGVDSEAANQVMDTIREHFVSGNAALPDANDSGVKLVDAVEFR